MKTFDVLIAGGGMVGAALACLLGRRGWSVCLVEAVDPQGQPLVQRVSAIALPVIEMLKQLDVWKHLPESQYCAFREMKVWDAVGRGKIHFNSADAQLPALGYIIENQAIQSALWTLCAELPNVEICCPSTVDDIQRCSIGINASVGNERVTARLLVGADGKNSQVRSWAMLPVSQRDYGHHALVSTVQTEYPHQETAWQRFLPTGPLAFLPLSDGRCSIVWSLPPEKARTLKNLDNNEFREQLSTAFEHRLGKVVFATQPVVFPLQMLRAHHYVADRVALIGDAAHVIHPLAGQGVNLGFLDAMTLASTLLESTEVSKQPGQPSLAVLRRYERWRKGHNLLVTNLMDAFKWLFSSQKSGLVWLRSIGLNVFNQTAWVKRKLLVLMVGSDVQTRKVLKILFK
jgi:2-polyprenylphenol 6-hydroxylase